MICGHIKIFKENRGKKKKTDPILILVRCKECGHKWIECKETLPKKK